MGRAQDRRFLRTGLNSDDRTDGGPGRTEPAPVLRVLLGSLGMAQLLLGGAQIGVLAAATNLLRFGGGGGATPEHLWHESAAWNIAVGAGFAHIALRRGRPTGLVPTLTAFVGVLTLLTVDDLIDGQVRVARVLSHTIILAGYAMILLMSRPGADPDEPASRRSASHLVTRDGDGEPEPPARPRLRLVRSHPDQADLGGRRAA